MASTVDMLIIGGGPAGLTAATGLVRQLHTAIVFDSGSYRNAASQHMHNLPTWDHQDPAEFRKSAKKDILARYSTVRFEDAEITSLKQLAKEEGTKGDGLFEAEDAKGRKWTGKKVIIATGVADQYPKIEGYADCWGQAIYHCLFCHGYEDRGASSAGVLAVDLSASAPHATSLARNACRFARKVTIYTHGNEALETELRKLLGDSPSTSSSSISFDNRPIARFRLAHSTTANGSSNSNGVKKEEEAEHSGGIIISFSDGSADATEAFLAHAPFTKPKGAFVEQLGLETAGPLGDIKASPPFNQTNVRGVFAAGDNMIMAKAVPTAIYNGSMACVGAVMQLQADEWGHKSMV